METSKLLTKNAESQGQNPLAALQKNYDELQKYTNSLEQRCATVTNDDRDNVGQELQNLRNELDASRKQSKILLIVAVLMFLFALLKGRR